MKTHTNSFKEQIKLIGKEIDSRITFGDTVLGKNDLNAVTPSYQGAILKSVMKQLDIDSNVEIPIGTILKYEFGLKVNGEYEYINYGNYVVYSVEKQEDTKSYKIVCYDKLLYSMLDYVKLPITYPISIRDYINSISTVLGLKFANKSGTFANYNKQIQADLYDGLGYTFRDVLDELAQVTASTICLNNNDELEIRYITETNDVIDEEFLKDVNVNFGEKFGAVNTIVLSRSADSDSVYYPSTLPANPYEIKISDNQIMNGNDRADFLPDIYDKLNGLEFYTNDFVSTGICYYDLCDRYSVKVGDNTYSCVMFNDEVLVTQGLEENIYTELPEQTETDYKHASKDDRMINQVYIIAKKNEAEILAVVNTTKQIQKEINPTKDENGSKIIIEDASNNPLTYLEIEGKSTQETRSGKNLLNASSELNVTTYINIDTDIKSGTYKITLDSINTNAISDKILFQFFNNDTLVTGKYFYLNTTEDTITLTSDINVVRVYSGSSYNESLDKTTTITNLMISKNGGDYEQYGISPSPEFPSEIESIGYENLFDKDNVTVGYIRNNNGTINPSSGAHTSDFINIKPNTNYIRTTREGNAYYDESKSFISYYYGNNILTPSNAKYIRITVIDNNLKTEQLEKGIQQHSYIPYGKSGIEVETVGKNLFNSKYVGDFYNTNMVTKNGITATMISDGVVRLQGTATKDTYFNFYGGKDNSQPLVEYRGSNVSYDNCDGKFVFGYFKEDGTIVNKLYSGDVIPNDAYSMRAYIIIGANVTIDKICYLQLEIGKSTTEYIPYQKNISVIVLNEPLRSLPNGVKDIAYIRNNKLYVDRYVGSVVLDGSENWAVRDKNDNGYSRFYVAINDGTTTTDASRCRCNMFTPIAYGYQQYSENLGVYNKYYYPSLLSSRLIDISDDAKALESFKTWLSTHNTQLDYELATPVTEELGEIEMLKTLKGYNNISTTDELLPIINLTYVRDTIIADYVENHVTELKLTENEIKASVESVSSSVDGLNTTINRVEEITNDNSQVINIISTNIDRTTGEVREVTTTNGFKFDSKGLNIYTDENSYNTQIDNVGTYYKDGNEVISQTTKDGSLLKNLKMQGQTQYSFDGDSYDFIEERVEIDGEYCYATFYNGEE